MTDKDSPESEVDVAKESKQPLAVFEYLNTFVQGELFQG